MKIKVAILGTGNIGTDLLLKCLKTNFIEVIAFVGRRLDSPNMQIAESKNIITSDQGINYFVNNPQCCDVVYDCTNALDAIKHSKIFKEQHIKVIDLTPAKVGDMCVPGINDEIILTDDNVNMITCGGQASMPMLHLIAQHCLGLEYIEVVSQIASKSAGNPAEPCVDMQTTIFVKAKNINFNNLTEKVSSRIEELKTYIPYYELILPPTLNESGILILSIRVKGAGDYLPEYAGNLDIINCATIKITEKLTER